MKLNALLLAAGAFFAVCMSAAPAHGKTPSWHSVRPVQTTVQKQGVCECDGVCYGVQWGDTLSHIALRHYGRASKFPVIAQANNIAGPEYRIYAGSCLCIPKATRVVVGPRIKRVRTRIPAVVTAPVQPAPQPAEDYTEAKLVPEERVPAGVQPEPIHSPQREPVKSAEPPSQPVTISIPRVTSAADIRPLHALPGQLWLSSGTVSPLETNNTVSSLHLEQGVTAIRSRSFSLVPFVGVDATKDEDNSDWNNKVVAQFGVKAVNTFKQGVVQFGGAYAHERRRESGAMESRPVWFANTWWGWDQPTRGSTAPWSAFPGSVWAYLGSPSPVEGSNVIASAYAEQGVTIAKLCGASLIPFGETLISQDTKGFEWNDKLMVGGGLKLAYPWTGGRLDLRLGRRCEYRGDRSECAPAAALNLWYGWNLKVGRRR